MSTKTRRRQRYTTDPAYAARNRASTYKSRAKRKAALRAVNPTGEITPDVLARMLQFKWP